MGSGALGPSQPGSHSKSSLIIRQPGHLSLAQHEKPELMRVVED